MPTRDFEDLSTQPRSWSSTLVAPPPIVHPLILALFETLPPPGSVWPTEHRILWLKAMEAIIELIYPYKSAPGETVT